MAELCGVSRSYYSDMENGRKPLNRKALDMIWEKNNDKMNGLVFNEQKK